MTAPEGKLGLDPEVVRTARRLAERAAQPVIELARTHSTVSVERAVVRLAGITGADAEGIPWVNRLVDSVRDQVGLEYGVALPVWAALATGDDPDLTALARKAAAGGVTFRLPTGHAAERARRASLQAVAGLSLIHISEPTR